MHASSYYDPDLVKNQLINPTLQNSRLLLPKANTLTDALLRATLGCD